MKINTIMRGEVLGSKCLSKLSNVFANTIPKYMLYNNRKISNTKVIPIAIGMAFISISKI